VAASWRYHGAVIRPRALFQAASDYIRRNPDELARQVRDAVGLRFGVPLAAFRWLVGQVIDEEQVEAVEIAARPPGLRMAGTFDLMETRVRGGAVLYIDRVEISATQLRVELRLEDVELVPIGARKTQISALLRAKALDVSRPGDLVANLPGMPDFIADAVGNRLAIDLMRVPKLARNARVRHAVGMLSTLVTLDRMGTESDRFQVELRALPHGISAVVEAMGEHVVAPGLRGVGQLMPEGVRGELQSGLSRVFELVAGKDDRAAA
jgi:hypothetical protein